MTKVCDYQIDFAFFLDKTTKSWTKYIFFHTCTQTNSPTTQVGKYQVVQVVLSFQLVFQDTKEDLAFFFPVAIHFHRDHPQPKTPLYSLCSIV